MPTPDYQDIGQALRLKPDESSELYQQVDLLRLRQVLENYDLEGFWEVLSPRLPGLPASHSQKNYLSAVRDFLRWAEGERLSILNPEERLGKRYQAYLQGRYGDKAASINTRLSQIKRVYKVLRQLGAVPLHLDPFGALERSVAPVAEHREYYQQADLQRLLARADQEDRALLLLGAHGGLLTHEVLELRWSEVQLTQGELWVGRRRVLASDELLAELHAQARAVGVGPLFQSDERVFDLADPNALRSRIYRLCRAANVEYRAWRALRHMAGLRHYRLTHDREALAEFLGVKNESLVQRYVELAEEGGSPERG